jgi:hypothetical protein
MLAYAIPLRLALLLAFGASFLLLVASVVLLVLWFTRRSDRKDLQHRRTSD